MTELRFEELVKGMRAFDGEHHGTLTDVSDIHNVVLEFDNGGSALVCMDEGCPERHPSDKLFRQA